jgi:hypothetical protein
MEANCRRLSPKVAEKASFTLRLPPCSALPRQSRDCCLEANLVSGQPYLLGLLRIVNPAAEKRWAVDGKRMNDVEL